MALAGLIPAGQDPQLPERGKSLPPYEGSQMVTVFDAQTRLGQ